MHASLNNFTILILNCLIGKEGDIEQEHAFNDYTGHPTVIELSSKSEVTSNIESLHSHFASLDSRLRDEFQELVEKGQVKLNDIAKSAATYLCIPVSSLKYTDVDELFDSLKPFYNFFNCGVLQHLTVTCPSTDKLTQYINDVEKFSESSQIKHIQSAIDDKLSHLQASPGIFTSNQTTTVVIKLNKRWHEMTINNFKKALQYYFKNKVTIFFSHISIKKGSVIITLQIPTSQAQFLSDTIHKKANSMNRLGITEAAVDNNTIPIRKEDCNNFDVSLHQSVKAGNSFEVSVLLQLGANPNNKDEEGKYPVQIAIESGHQNVLQTLLTGGANESLGKLMIIYLWTLKLTTPSNETH